MDSILLSVMLGGGTPVRENIWQLPAGVGVIGLFFMMMFFFYEMFVNDTPLAQVRFSQTAIYLAAIFAVFVAMGVIVALITTAS